MSIYRRKLSKGSQKSLQTKTSYNGRKLFMRVTERRVGGWAAAIYINGVFVFQPDSVLYPSASEAFQEAERTAKLLIDHCTPNSSAEEDAS